jgi:hypothetical protein
MWFDKVRTEAGVMALRNYHRGPSGKPVHNWASHASDAMRVGCVAMNMIQPMIGGTNIIGIGAGAMKRNLKRMNNGPIRRAR